MKRIKSFLAVLVAIAMSVVTLTSCTDYQDEIDGLDSRVTALEQLVADMNTNLSSLSSIVTAMDAGDYITNVTSNSDGYIVTFAKAGAITVKNGTNGIDAVTPVILPVKDADGNYYWQLNGEWLLDADGNKVRANGKDGAGASAPVVGQKQDTDGNYYWTLNGEWLIVDGHKVRANGLDGTGAIAPQVRINPSTNEWEVSTDGGTTWNSTGVKATGNDGADAVSPQVRINPSTNEWEVSTDGGSTWTGTGVNATGSDGANAQSLIKSIVDGTDFVTITLSDDTVINIPKTAAVAETVELIIASDGENSYFTYMLPEQTGTFTLDEIGLTADQIDNMIIGSNMSVTIEGNTVTVVKGSTWENRDVRFLTTSDELIRVSFNKPNFYICVNGALPKLLQKDNPVGTILVNKWNDFNVSFAYNAEWVDLEKQNDTKYMYSILRGLSSKYFRDFTLTEVEITQNDGIKVEETAAALEGTQTFKFRDSYLVYTKFNDSELLERTYVNLPAYYMIRYRISITRNDGEVLLGGWSNRVFGD
ncbi:MAG: PL29 family lyase N-terminal domain-containing protein [Prevotella sp.]